MKRGMMQMNDQKQMSHKAGKPKDQRAIANEDDGFSAREMRRIEEGRRRERRRRGAVPHPGDGAARGDAPAPEAKGRTLSDRHPPPSPRPLENQNRTRPLSLLLSPLPSGGGGGGGLDKRPFLRLYPSLPPSRTSDSVRTLAGRAEFPSAHWADYFSGRIARWRPTEPATFRAATATLWRVSATHLGSLNDGRQPEGSPPAAVASCCAAGRRRRRPNGNLVELPEMTAPLWRDVELR